METRHIATGDFDGNLSIYDLENMTIPVCNPLMIYHQFLSFPIQLYNVKGHQSIINCIDGIGGLGIGNGAPEIVTGSRDGRLIVVITIKISQIYCEGFACGIQEQKLQLLRWLLRLEKLLEIVGLLLLETALMMRIVVSVQDMIMEVSFSFNFSCLKFLSFRC